MTEIVPTSAAVPADDAQGVLEDVHLVPVLPRLHRDEMDRIAGQFEEAGFHAMGGSVARSRRLVAPESHPADGEVTRGHGSAL